MRIQTYMIFPLALCLLSLSVPAQASPEEKTISFGMIGGSEGVFEEMKSCEEKLNIRAVHFTPDAFAEDQLPDATDLDMVYIAFADEQYKEKYGEMIMSALALKPSLRIFTIGPPPMHALFSDWFEPGILEFDATMAQYYGLSRKDTENMLRYALVTYFGRSGEASPPDLENAVKVFHPRYGSLQTVAEFLQAAKGEGIDVDTMPRVAIGTFRHHVVYHQPQVVKALIEGFEKEGILAVCLVADEGLQEKLLEFGPGLVIMTSHTREPVPFWDKLNVPRIHAIWFMEESVEQWGKSTTPGMRKGSIQHLYISAEVRGATECLTSGGTQSGNRSGEEIEPIPDRISRIVGRAKAWIDLGSMQNKEKKIAIIGYDHSADKSGLLCGAQLGLNAPRSMVRFLEKMKEAGYALADVPADEDELLERLMDHGRQMGSWEKGALDRLARGGASVLVPEERYREWFDRKIPPREQAEMIKYWGEPPGSLMVWEQEGKKYLVLPKIDLGAAVLMTQPPKGEALSAKSGTMPQDEMLPPSHHFMGTYFWLQEEFKPDALIHFGAHGNEWLFPGKQAALSKADWSDMLLGNMPNINPWVSNNTAELVPCKRRAYAVTVDHLPPILMAAGLSDEMLNLESTIDKYITLEEGALKAKFAASVTEQTFSSRLDRELTINKGENGLLDDEEIQKVSTYLHELHEEAVPANMHVLGQKPAENLLIPYYVYCMGKRFLNAAQPLYGVSEDTLKTKAEEAIKLILHEDLTPLEAVLATGGTVEAEGLPEIVQESLEMVMNLNVGMDQTSSEIDKILRALNGEFVSPGPSGSPERNPGVVPTGRNLYVLNPEELPTKASWELGTKMISDYLETQRKAKGRYPRKIAFGLVPYATYSDYGIIESQILFLIGVRPVWDLKNRVEDVELIPAEELGRPRIDVFLSAKSIYRDELPGMMKMLDKAIRMVASLDEPNNYVYDNTLRTLKGLQAKGVSSDEARIFSQARMYGPKPEENVDGHNWYFYLTERSGEWETREELMEVYLSHCRFVYTEGMWGVDAPEAFNAAAQDTELIVRSWYDNRDAVLANKFTWWSDGSLSLAIKHLTGKEPDYVFADVRNPDKAVMTNADQAVQRDLRARILNPKWIQAMMKEGYNGATQISKNINNMMGWEIMREHSIDDSNWNELSDFYVNDSENLGLPDWFDQHNPHAFQNIAATMLETVRKQYWDADDQRLMEITAAYAESVANHGPVGGLRSGGNAKLDDFVEQTLSSSQDPKMGALLAKYQAAMKQSSEARESPQETETEQVTGYEMEQVSDDTDDIDVQKPYPIKLFTGLGLVAIVILGYVSRRRSFSK